MAHAIPELWKSPFARFVESYGVECLAAELDVRPSAIYHWIGGTHAPKPVHAKVISNLARESGVKLTLDQIYGHFLDLRAIEDKARAAGFPDDADPRELIRASRGNVAPL